MGARPAEPDATLEAATTGSVCEPSEEPNWATEWQPENASANPHARRILVLPPKPLMDALFQNDKLQVRVSPLTLHLPHGSFDNAQDYLTKNISHCFLPNAENGTYRKQTSGGNP